MGYPSKLGKWQQKTEVELRKILANEKSDTVMHDGEIAKAIRERGLLVTREGLQRLRKDLEIPNSFERKHALYEQEFKAKAKKRK